MKVFLDTNVLVSAFTTRGLCADVLRQVLAEHVLVTGEVVLEELGRVLAERFRLPARQVEAIVDFLGAHHVQPRPQELPAIEIRDPDDLWVFASALAAGADVLITGDKDLLDLRNQEPGIAIVDPRGFWNLLRELSPG